MKKRGRRAGALMIVLGLAVLLTPVGSAFSQLDGGPEGPDALVPPEEEPGAMDLSDGQGSGADERGSTAALSSQQESRALDLIARDQRVQRFLAGREHRVTEIGPWTDGDQLVGATILLGFAEPQSFSTSAWPQIDYGSPLGGTEPYKGSVVELAAEKVTELLLDVDFDKGRVVSIVPDGPNVRIIPAGGVTATEVPTEPGY